jgi:hypothetical protein
MLKQYDQATGLLICQKNQSAFSSRPGVWKKILWKKKEPANELSAFNCGVFDRSNLSLVKWKIVSSLGTFTAKINGPKIRGFEKYENTKLKCRIKQSTDVKNRMAFFDISNAQLYDQAISTLSDAR